MFQNMWFLNEIFILCFISLIAIFFVNKLNYWKKLPPGPFGLPFVGYFPFLTKNPHLKFLELGKKYGNIFSLQFGSRLAVVLNDGESIREAFSKPEFLGRPKIPIFEKGDVLKSPFFNNGKLWSEHRKFALHTLRDLGFGKSQMQYHIQEEIKDILKSIEEKPGQPFIIQPLLIPSMSNNISSLVFGKRYDLNDPERNFLDSLIPNFSKIVGESAIFVCFPWILYFPFRIFLNVKNAIMTVENMVSFIKRKIKIHKETLDDNHVRDVIDSYLIEEKCRSKKDPNTTFSDTYLAGMATILFAAGSNTVRTSVEWCMCVLAAYPEVQNKIYFEINKVIGTERLPEIGDQKYMLYTQSVLQEIRRWKTIIPLNVVRITLDDVDVLGFHIPKDTLIFANFWATHHDERCWKQPDSFIPERFLNEEGKTLLKNENYMPFSYGKRSCPGENLGVLEIFLYVTSILQKFIIKPVNNATIDLEGKLSLAYEPKIQKLLYIPR